MAKKVARSKFWIVSTHALTTGFAMPLLAGIVAGILLVALSGQSFHPLLVAGFVLAMTTLGYIGGTYYSLSYLRKSAYTENWSACTLPSIITFAILAVAMMAYSLYRAEAGDVLGMAIQVGYYVLIIVAFSFITKKGFARMDEEQSGAQGFPVQLTR